MLNNQTTPPLLLFLHGFGQKRTAELDSLRQAFQQDMDILMPDLFDPTDARDSDGILWANRALAAVERQLLKGREIILGGFSMGAVIACWVASQLPVRKLILVSPAFDLLNLKNTGNVLNTVLHQFAHLQSPQDLANFNGLPSPFYQTLLDVVSRFRPYAAQLHCPVLLIHGSEDSIVSVQSARYAFARIPSAQKQMFTLENGHHVLFEDEGVCQEVLALIRLFLQDQIVVRPDVHSPDQAVKTEIHKQD